MIVLLVLILAMVPVLADTTIGTNVVNSATTSATTQGTAVAVFATNGTCRSVLVQALRTNTDDVNIVIDNDGVNTTTGDGYVISLQAREIFRFRNVGRRQMLFFVDTGTEGLTAICELN